MAASITPGYAFASTEQVTAAKLASLVSNATITGITNTEIASDAAIAYSKINVTAAAINYDRLNLTGGIVNADVSASAAIAYSKLALTGAVVSGDLAGSVADSKLSQITTASKVHGSSITGLASLPAGAGVIPTANLPALGALTLVSNTALSGVTTSGDITIDSTKQYLVKVVLSEQGSAQMTIRFNNDSTSGNYQYISRGWSGNAVAANANSTSATFIATAIETAANTNGGTYIDFNIYPQCTAGTKKVQVKGQIKSEILNSATNGFADFNGYWGATATVTSFRINNAAASMTGNVYLYSVATS